MKDTLLKMGKNHEDSQDAWIQAVKETWHVYIGSRVLNKRTLKKQINLLND